MPGVPALLPYLDEYWRDQLVNRHIDKYSFALTSYPPNSPLSARPDWRQASGAPAGDLDAIRGHALDPFGTRLAICNVLHGALALFNEDMAAALCTAVNDWVTHELIDREPRLRASILVPAHNPALAVKEIERRASDRRFAQVLLLAMGEMLLGRRVYWPIYAAAEKHGLAIGIHAGSTYHHAPMPSGWPAHRVEDYVAQSTAFESQVLSFVTEGVFQKFPTLRLVLLESGVTWLPTLLWRTNKTWRGVRTEVPWIDRPPAEIVREHVRLTLQPVDVPRNDPRVFARVLAHAGCEHMLLFSTDYPHWHFDGEDVLPDGLAGEVVRKLMVDNPLETYPRLRDGTVATEPVLRDNAAAG
jgi:predicted TIM-barrel fold metal-dependent hydrolase